MFEYILIVIFYSFNFNNNIKYILDLIILLVLLMYIIFIIVFYYLIF